VHAGAATQRHAINIRIELVAYSGEHDAAVNTGKRLCSPASAPCSTMHNTVPVPISAPSPLLKLIQRHRYTA
jgi:hypothetical protein